jgi:hypothetical protein
MSHNVRAGPPVPQFDELTKTAESGGYRVVMPESEIWPFPVCRAKRRVHGLSADVVEVAGRDFYDYVATLDQTDLSKCLDAIKHSDIANGIDCVLLEQIIASDGVQAKGVVRFSYRTAKVVAPAGNTLSTTLRRHQSIRRHVQTAQRKVGLVTETFCDDSRIRQLLPSLARLHVERWGVDDVKSAFLQPQRIRQYESAASRAMITRVMAGEEMLGIHYGLVFDDTLLWHTPVINIAFLDFSPLEVLMNAVAESCDNRGIGTIDLGLGDEGYKARFATDSRRVYEYIIPVSLKGYLIATLKAKLDVQRWRSQGVRVLRLARSARAKILQKLSRVRYFRSVAGAGPGIAMEDYVEVKTWPNLVALLRCSGIEIKRYQYHRLRSGVCFLCLLQDARIVSYGWMWTKNEPFVVGETGESLAAGTAVLYDFVTLERHRNLGHYTRLLKAIIAARPDTTFCIFASANNKASLAGIQRAGYVECRRETFSPMCE